MQNAKCKMQNKKLLQKILCIKYKEDILHAF